MRVIPTPALLVSPAIVVAALLGCAPPNPENDAPFIEVVSPTGRFDRELGATRFRVFADRPAEIVLRFSDRKTVDGDFTVSLGIDPSLSADIGSIEGVQRFEGVPIDEAIPFLLDPGFPEGESDLVIVANDDLGPIIEEDGKSIDLGERTARYRMTGEVVDFPVIEPANPTTGDELNGVLANVIGDYFESTWTLDGETTPTVVQAGVDARLPASETARGDVWVFCVGRWDADSQEQRLLPREEWPAPVLEVCSEVEIGNTPPGRTEITVLPTNPNATTPLFCEGTATDADGDALTISYEWSDGTVTHAGQWLDPADTAPGETWSCRATASDGDLTGPPDNTDTSLTLRVASVVLNGNLISGGTFTPAGRVQTKLAPVLQGTSGSVMGILTGHTDTSLIYSANAPNLSPGFTLTGGTGFGGAIATGDLDADGEKDAVISEDGAFYTVFSGGLTDGGSGSASAIGSSFVQVGTLDDAGFGTALSIGQHRSLATDQGQLDVAVTWTRPLPPNEVRLFDGVAFSRSGGGISVATSVATISGGSALFGTVLASGDLDGDGLDELVITDPGAGSGEIAVMIYRGGSTISGALAPSAAYHRLALNTGGAATGIGTSAVFADLDGDGLQDLVVGAPEANNSRGAVYVFRGGTLAGDSTADLLSAAADTLTGTLDGDRFGATLAVVRDPSGLFSDTLAVGAPGVSGGNGAVYLFEGSGVATANTGADADLSISGGAGGTNAQLGVHDADDLNGDGFPDVVVVANSGTSRFWILGSAF